jgi:hypothetical protein
MIPRDSPQVDRVLGIVDIDSGVVSKCSHPQLIGLQSLYTRQGWDNDGTGVEDLNFSPMSAFDMRALKMCTFALIVRRPGSACYQILRRSSPGSLEKG